MSRIKSVFALFLMVILCMGMGSKVEASTTFLFDSHIIGLTKIIDPEQNSAKDPNGTWEWDAAKNTLTLNNYNGGSIWFGTPTNNKSKTVHIILKGKNTITGLNYDIDNVLYKLEDLPPGTEINPSALEYGIINDEFAEKMVITGSQDASLTINMTDIGMSTYSMTMMGIYSDGDIDIHSANINININAELTSGISAENITIDGDSRIQIKNDSMTGYGISAVDSLILLSDENISIDIKNYGYGLDGDITLGGKGMLDVQVEMGQIIHLDTKIPILAPHYKVMEGDWYTSHIKVVAEGYTPPTTTVTPLPTIENGIVLTIGSNSYSKIEQGKETKVSMDVSPMIHQGRTMLPARGLAEILNLEVTYDTATKTASFVYTDPVDQTIKNTLQLTLNQNHMMINDKKLDLSGELIVREGRMLLPLTDLQKALQEIGVNKKIQWLGDTKQVVITE